MGTGHVHLQTTDTYAGLDSWLHRWEPRLKLGAGLLFVVGVVSLTSLPAAAAALGLALPAALSARLPARFLVGRLLWLAPFLALMTLTLALGSGWPPSIDGLKFAALVSLKAVTALTVMTTLLGTQTMQASLSTFANLRLPHLPVLALFLAYRYLFLFRDEMKRARMCLAARAFRPGPNRHSLRAAGELTGTRLLGALDRSERVYRAMSARGFNGRLPVEQSREVTSGDLYKGLVALVTVAALMVLDRGILL